MDAFVAIALVGVVLLVAELLLPTGGVLAVLGALGLVAAGIVALTAESDSTATEYAGPALITLGILSIVTFYFVTRKVIAAHRDEPIRTGSEEIVGSLAEVRTGLDPEGQVWVGGALWQARLESRDSAGADDGGDGPRPGDRVVVEAVDGLTLVVRPKPPPAQTAEQGAG
jgi:membrane-bound serine protease (ClpP class)